MAIKIPIIIADIVTGMIIWKVIAKTSKSWANFAFVFYTLNPVILFDGSVWGQIDGLLTMLMLGTVYLVVEKSNYYMGAVLAGIALLVKPQAIAMMPILLILVLVRFGIKKTITFIAMQTFIIILGFYPFFPQNPIVGLLDLSHKMGVSYSYTSLFAFNIWSFVGMWIADTTKFVGISYFSWGTGIMALAFAIMIFRYRKHFSNDHDVYLMFALSFFVFFLFPTRVHDRYLFPMYAFLMTYAGLKKSRKLMIMTAVSSIAYVLNLYLPYSYYESVHNPLKNVELEIIIQKMSLFLTSLQLIIFAGLWLFPGREKIEKGVPVNTGYGKTIEHGGDK